MGEIKDNSVFQKIHGRETFGQRAADRLTKIAGSWGFIIFFILFILTWMTLNLTAWINSWDLYPFILLNLVLSCLAALQAPVILMSQNRQSQIDRRKAEYDYRVNVKAEKEIEVMQKQLDRIESKLNKKQ